MTEELNSKWVMALLDPFGIEVKPKRLNECLSEADAQSIKQLVEDHRVVVFRGFVNFPESKLPEFCSSLGEILEWSFGAVNDLRVHDDPRNYLFTNHMVPFHWDGAFVGKIPHYIFFQCELAPDPGAGGGTQFCDTLRVLGNATPELLTLWNQITVTYSTEKVAHYGGTFTSPVVTTHPITGEPVLRFAEPVEDLNPVRLEFGGIPSEMIDGFLKDMNARLNNQANCYVHRWASGDIVIADNYTLLHGREAFLNGAPRHIRRVNIM